jgi:hypothetical protein
MELLHSQNEYERKEGDIMHEYSILYQTLTDFVRRADGFPLARRYGASADEVRNALEAELGEDIVVISCDQIQ